VKQKLELSSPKYTLIFDFLFNIIENIQIYHSFGSNILNIPTLSITTIRTISQKIE